MKKVLLTLFCFLMSVGPFLVIQDVKAFCVYNNSDRNIYVWQTDGGRWARSFDKTVKPGKHACCNWKNKDCNKRGKRNSKIGLNVGIANKDGIYEDLCSVSMPAGGWLKIEGENDHYVCKKGF